MQNKCEISVDKIALIYKLSNKITNINFDKFDNKMLDSHFLVKDSFTSTKICSYQYNYTYIKNGSIEGVIYIGFIFRDVTSTKPYIKIEFNPNKVELPYCITEFLYFYNAKFFKVQNCDIAFDFQGLTINDYRVCTRSDTMVYSTGLNRTYYIRPKTDFRVKIYDKKIEREKYGISIPQTLRIEITLKNPTFFETNIKTDSDFEYIHTVTRYLSEISLRRFTSFLPTDIDTYNPAFLYLLNNVDVHTATEALSMCDKKTRQKYKKLQTMTDFEKIDLDSLALLDILTDYIRNLIPLYITI